MSSFPPENQAQSNDSRDQVCKLLKAWKLCSQNFRGITWNNMEDVQRCATMCNDVQRPELLPPHLKVGLPIRASPCLCTLIGSPQRNLQDFNRFQGFVCLKMADDQFIVVSSRIRWILLNQIWDDGTTGQHIYRPTCQDGMLNELSSVNGSSQGGRPQSARPWHQTVKSHSKSHWTRHSSIQ